MSVWFGTCTALEVLIFCLLTLYYHSLASPYKFFAYGCFFASVLWKLAVLYEHVERALFWLLPSTKYLYLLLSIVLNIMSGIIFSFLNAYEHRSHHKHTAHPAPAWLLLLSLHTPLFLIFYFYYMAEAPTRICIVLYVRSLATTAGEYKISKNEFPAIKIKWQCIGIYSLSSLSLYTYWDSLPFAPEPL